MLKSFFNLEKRRGGVASPLFFIICFFVSSTCFSSSISRSLEAANEKKLWSSKKWHRLLHYRKNLINGYESEADGANFFVHKNGKTDPKSELLALLNSLNNGVIDKNHPLCKFPARLKWLQKETGFSRELLKFNQCQNFQNYLKVHNAKKIHLVFSSYYLESPASTFGHTLFRLSKSNKLKQSKHSELLDTAISYGANMTTDNPILYSLLGTMGGFKGSLVSLPYYYKIREYNDHESRDLWSYELNLTEEEIEVIIDHLWELGQTVFDYYYFDENCAYYLLTILEVANDNYDLVSKLPIYTIPVDTIKIVESAPGLVKNINYRPSIRKKTEFFITQLNVHEEKIFDEVVKSRNIDLINQRGGSDKSKAYITDSLINFIDLKHPTEVLNEKGSNYEWKMDVLEYRSKIDHPGNLNTVASPLREMPHLAHGSARLKSSLNSHNFLGESLQIDYRFALHDILDPFLGQPKNSSIEFLNTKLRYYKNLSEFKLHQLTVVQVKNLHPWSKYQKLPALSLKFGYKTVDFNLCSLCLAPNFDLGWGSSHSLSNGSVLNFLFNTDISYSSKFYKNDFSIGIGPEINFYYWWREIATSKISTAYYNFPLQESYSSILRHETRFHINKRFDLILKNNFRSSVSEHSFGLSYFH